MTTGARTIGGMLCAVVGLFDCSGGGKAADQCPEPLYDSKATDEARNAIVDAEPLVMRNDMKASMFIEPPENAMYHAADPAPTFKWSSSLQAWLHPKGAPARSRETKQRSLLDRAEELLIGTAFAHLPPVTGALHDLKIRIPGQKCPIEIVTTETQYQLDADTWGKLKATSGAQLTLEITSAYLRGNRVTEGPYRPMMPRALKVVP